MKKIFVHIKKWLRYYILSAFVLMNVFLSGQALLSSSASAEVSGLFSNFLSAFFHAIGPVEAELVEPETITISGPDIVIIGQSKRLTPTISPLETTDKSVYWQSDDTDVLEVTSGGIVVAKSLGSAVIRATSSIPSIYVETSIEVIDFPNVASFDFEDINTDIYVGTTTRVTLKDVTPELAKPETISWSSLHEHIATVNEYGVVKGVSAGSATIKATAGTFEKTIIIDVATSPTPVIAPTSLTISGDSEGFIYRNHQLSVDFGATPPTDTSITWLSSDINIARVDETGNVYGYKFEGSVTITAIANADDAIRDTFTMSFSKVYPTSVSLAPEKSVIIAGQSMRITFEFDPMDTYDRQLVWTSSDPDIASISSRGEYGLFTAKKMGSVTIYAASTMDESVGASTTIEVQKASTLNDEQERDLYTFVRKGLGHYSLFLVDGILGYFVMYFFLKGKKAQYRYLLMSLAVGLVLSVGIESLQLFANGRSPLLTDAIINFLGYLTASLVVYFVFVYREYKVNKARLKESLDDNSD